jgi:hypothetical protein
MINPEADYQVLNVGTSVYLQQRCIHDSFGIFQAVGRSFDLQSTDSLPKRICTQLHQPEIIGELARITTLTGWGRY